MLDHARRFGLSFDAIELDWGGVFDWRLYDEWQAVPTWPGWSRLHSVRFWSGLSQEELAAAVGASRKTISSLENGRSTPSLALARALARELSVTLDELFADDELR